MTHQEDPSPRLAQETSQETSQDSLQKISSSSQEGFLIPSEEQLEKITGAGLVFSKDPTKLLIEPKLVRTPSGRVARNRLSYALHLSPTVRNIASLGRGGNKGEGVGLQVC